MGKAASLLNVPNLLTLSRLVLMPWIVMAVRGGRHVEALAVFFVAAFTDLLDGWTARRFGIATPVGAYFDPIADKCLLIGVYFALWWGGVFPGWLMAIVFGRDLFIVAGAGIVMFFTPVRRFPPSVWGKVSTFFQISNVVVWLTRDAFPVGFLNLLAFLSLWLCVGFTVWSGMDYGRRGVEIARTH